MAAHAGRTRGLHALHGWFPWRPAYAKAGIPKGTGSHALRNHYASLLIKHGESVKTVSERLGHTNAAMTLNICGPTPKNEPGPPSTRRTRTSPPTPSYRSTKRRSPYPRALI
ncbi:tyrosine-type recombinase/integrase [Streptomyces antimycoticus]|uniref:tyrosine-type recombinase/integrase n=1 Tax=Streptomyces antimycoticus TaxID=68175 RepID=UPI0036E10262